MPKVLLEGRKQWVGRSGRWRGKGIMEAICRLECKLYACIAGGGEDIGVRHL